MPIPYAKIEKVVNAYHSGRFTDELIKQYENAYKKPISEIISHFEKLLHKRKYCISEMIITDLRKLIKNADKLSEAEKQTYIEANNNQDFLCIISSAQRRVSAFDDDKEARSIRGAIKKLEDSDLSRRRSDIIFKDMEAKGLGKYAPSTQTFSSNLVTMQDYKNNFLDVYARIIHDFSTKPRDVHTMPETGLDLEWFYTSVCEEKIIVQQAKNKQPSCKFNEPIILNQNKLVEMMHLYINIKHGYKLKEYPSVESKFWLGIFKLLRISARIS